MCPLQDRGEIPHHPSVVGAVREPPTGAEGFASGGGINSPPEVDAIPHTGDGIQKRPANPVYAPLS